MEYLWGKMLRDKYLSSYFSHPFVISNWALSRGKAISTISSTAGLSVDASPFINSLECSLMGRRVGYDLQTSLFPYIMLRTFRFSGPDSSLSPSALLSQRINLTMHNNHTTWRLVCFGCCSDSQMSIGGKAGLHSHIMWAEDHTKPSSLINRSVKTDWYHFQGKTGEREQEQAQDDIASDLYLLCNSE